MKTQHIIEKNELEEIIKSSRVCYMAMVDEEGFPYVLPFNFAYEEGVLFFHSGNDGKKLSVLRKNPQVCIVFSKEGEVYIQSQSIGCSYSMQFESVMVYGEVQFMENTNEKTELLHRIMHHYTSNREYGFSQPSVENVACFTVKITSMTGRKR